MVTGTNSACHRISKGEYIEIDRPKLLIFTFGGPGFPDTLVRIEIKPLKKGCELTLTHEGVWVDYKERTQKGWTTILEGLTKDLGEVVRNEDLSSREIVITRVLNASRERVWEAWTDPNQVVKWWGPKGFTTTIEKMEVKVGGVWQHTMHGPNGTDYPNKSVFLEVVKPERIVYSHGGGKKGGPGAQFEATWTFEAQKEWRSQ